MRIFASLLLNLSKVGTMHYYCKVFLLLPILRAPDITAV